MSKNQIKFVKSLQQKKFRLETGLFVIEGKKMVQELIFSGWDIDQIIVREGEIIAGVSEKKNITATATKKEMERMSNMKTAPEVMAIARQKEYKSSDALKKNCLVLDGIKDPGNLGTIIRSADWFGIEHIVCSKDTVELYNPKTVQSTMGSIFRSKVSYSDLGQFLASFREHSGIVMGTMMNGKDIFHTVFPPVVALVIGSEAHGIREAVVAMLDEIVAIPGGISTESLNASVAAGIACSEWYRRKTIID